jgi:hypothetical protein
MTDRPDMTPDRARYITLKSCAAKRRYETYSDAWEKGSAVYACDQCGAFHRTSKPLNAAAQIKLIERIFGGSITPAKVTAFNELPVRNLRPPRVKTST